MTLTLTVLPESLAICRCDRASDLPIWAMAASFFSVTRTQDELSIVCPEARIPADVVCERGWRSLKFEGPFDFNLTGILVAVAAPLAEAGISIFAVSTYETDYVLVRQAQLAAAIDTLSACGHRVQT